MESDWGGVDSVSPLCRQRSLILKQAKFCRRDRGESCTSNHLQYVGKFFSKFLVHVLVDLYCLLNSYSMVKDIIIHCIVIIIMLSLVVGVRDLQI